MTDRQGSSTIIFNLPSTQETTSVKLLTFILALVLSACAMTPLQQQVETTTRAAQAYVVQQQAREQQEALEREANKTPRERACERYSVAYVAWTNQMSRATVDCLNNFRPETDGCQAIAVLNDLDNEHHVLGEFDECLRDALVSLPLEEIVRVKERQVATLYRLRTIQRRAEKEWEPSSVSF